MSTMRFLRTCQLSFSSEAPTASRHSEARWWGGGRWIASAPFSGPHCRASRELRSLTAIHPARPEDSVDGDRGEGHGRRLPDLNPLSRFLVLVLHGARGGVQMSGPRGPGRVNPVLASRRVPTSGQDGQEGVPPVAHPPPAIPGVV